MALLNEMTMMDSQELESGDCQHFFKVMFKWDETVQLDRSSLSKVSKICEYLTPSLC